jgi:pyruvate/2-oxoglutarate dehydrogenase complex dihydrolipoamide dehydrogenase (E3) component
MKRVKARKDEIVAQSRNGVTRWMEGLANNAVYRGHARFTASKTVKVNGELLSADRIIINTGGRAFIPDMPGLDSVPYLTNTSMMEVDFLPEHLLIVGGSYIGLEFAQVYRRFGARVTVVDHICLCAEHQPGLTHRPIRKCRSSPRRSRDNDLG